MRQQPAYVVIGAIVKAHGLKGEVRIKLLTDDPERFKRLKSVFIERNQGEFEVLEIVKAISKGQEVYLLFKDMCTREQAQDLIGDFISVKREDVLPLKEGHFYHFEVAGFDVITTSGEIIGSVERVMELPANDVIVCTKNKQEFLIPVIKDVILDIDKDGGKVIIHPIEGLFD